MLQTNEPWHLSKEEGTPIIDSKNDVVCYVESQEKANLIANAPDLLSALDKAVMRLEIVQDHLKENVIEKLHNNEKPNLESVSNQYARITDFLMQVSPLLKKIQSSE